VLHGAANPGSRRFGELLPPRSALGRGSAQTTFRRFRLDRRIELTTGNFPAPHRQDTRGALDLISDPDPAESRAPELGVACAGQRISQEWDEIRGIAAREVR